MFATDDWFAVAENLLKVSSIILISGAPAVRSTAKRSTCMHRKRKACNSFFMVNVASGMDRWCMRNDDDEKQRCCTQLIHVAYLALINRAGGLYGRILTEVVNTDRGQDSPTQTDLARLIRCLLYGKEENFNSFNVTGFLTFCLRTAMS